jgi:hypothetical protein
MRGFFKLITIGNEVRYGMELAWKMFNSFALQHFLCIRHWPVLQLASLLGLLGLLGLSVLVLEPRMHQALRCLGVSALDSRRTRTRSW